MTAKEGNLMQVRQYPLRQGRELRVAQVKGRIVVAIHDRAADYKHSVTAIAISPDEIDTLRSALADACGETGSEEATDTAPDVRGRPLLGNSL